MNKLQDIAPGQVSDMKYVPARMDASRYHKGQKGRHWRKLTMHGLKKSTLHVSLSTFMFFPVWFILGFTRGFATAMPCMFSQCKKIASPALFVSLVCQYLMQSVV